jgi:hypothetical protein
LDKLRPDDLRRILAKNDLFPGIGTHVDVNFFYSGKTGKTDIIVKFHDAHIDSFIYFLKHRFTCVRFQGRVSEKIHITMVHDRRNDLFVRFSV